MKYAHVMDNLEIYASYDDEAFLFPGGGLDMVSLEKGCSVKALTERETVDIDGMIYENEYVIGEKVVVEDWTQFLLSTIEVLFYAAQSLLTREFPPQERDTWPKLEEWAEKALAGDQQSQSKIKEMITPHESWEDYARKVLARRDFYENFIVASRKARSDAEEAVLAGSHVGNEVAFLRMINNETKSLLEDMLGVMV